LSFFENFFCVLIVKRLNGCAVSRFLGFSLRRFYACGVSEVHFVEGFAVLGFVGLQAHNLEAIMHGTLLLIGC
jgi:hypothetical protein